LFDADWRTIIVLLMRTASDIFDRIRVKPEDDRARAPEGPACEHPGCRLKGEYRAPKGRAREGEYFRFCLEHVREYNASYNYFAGMPDDAVASFQKSAVTGHRPTWSMGVNGSAGARPAQTNPWAENEAKRRAGDPFEFFREAGFGPRTGTRETPERERPTVRAAERRAFATLDLDTDSTPEEIKARYKALVKRFHPDANGGDRAMEDRFREIVQAYAFLKGAGFAT
jgi:hypothetical protein